MIKDIQFVKTPSDIASDIVGRMKSRRKGMKLTQQQLASKSGVSFGSIKRFETQGEISLESLIKVAIALGCEKDFESLFSHRFYSSIEELLNDQRK